MKIQLGKITFEDTNDKIQETEQGIWCCEKNISIAAFANRGDFYEYTYKCECGNVIKAVIERSAVI